jgi:predicted metal-dependent phosphotriesterase family hydrolase
MNPTVQTVLGPVPPEQLGRTLAHEHFFTVTYDSPGMYLADPELALLELEEARAAGTQSVIDLTTFDLGRRPSSLAELSRRSGVNIVMGTGWYIHKTYPNWINSTSTEKLARLLIDDIENGEDGIRPGVIGEIGIAGDYVDAREERVLRAVARAHAVSGLTIFIHQQRVSSGPAALRILNEEGVSSDRVVFCHMDSIEDPSAQRVAADLGVWLSYDRIQGWDLVHQLKPWEVDRRRQLLRRAGDEGYLDRVLLSTDCCVKGDLRRYGGPGYAYTHGMFADSLRDSGFDDSDLELLFISNPMRALTGSL